ncbi:MAG TPA: SHOCT domain-containing protein [Pseudobacteroides sp.]|uniref:SHOCT domain-containing protein n=1 Tax=Pseudobacteroides sp. TaxID=1968840 RepID=UPI002F95E2F6
MTNSQLQNEIKYQTSISPFRNMLEAGKISSEDYAVIDTILRGKYRPIFVGYISPNSVDNTTNQS